MSSDPYATFRRRLLRRRVLTVAVPVLLVAAVIAWFALRGTAPGLVVEVQSLSASDTGVTSFAVENSAVELPSGRMKLSVTEPLKRFPDGVEDFIYQNSRQDDPEYNVVRGGGRWVGVSWELLPTKTSKAQQVLGLDFSRSAEVALVADGQRYDLQADRADGWNEASQPRKKSVFVALPDTPAHLTLEVTYDGLTQTFVPATSALDTADADGLYDVPVWSVSAPGCEDLRITPAPGFEFNFDEDVVTCDVPEVVSTAYLEGQGWAKQGRTWLGAPILTYALSPFAEGPARADDPSRLYALKLRSTAVTIKGKPPVAMLNYYQQAPDELRENQTGARYVFDVAKGEEQTLAFEQAYGTKRPPDNPPDPPVGTVGFSATLTPGS